MSLRSSTDPLCSAPSSRDSTTTALLRVSRTIDALTELIARTNAIIDAVGMVVFLIPVCLILISLSWPVFGKAFDQLLKADQSKQDNATPSMGAGGAPAPDASTASAATEAGNEDSMKGLSAARELLSVAACLGARGARWAVQKDQRPRHRYLDRCIFWWALTDSNCRPTD